MSFNFLHSQLQGQDRGTLERNMSGAFSLMGDVQELIAMGSYNKARELLNDAKKILINQYQDDELVISD